MLKASDFKSVSTKLQRIAELAKNAPGMAFTTLAHHIDIAFLEEAFRRTRKDGATGIDGQTADEYGTELRKNLASLLERFKSGSYHAPPVRRVHIPKGDGSKTRPIGIPTFEDKVLQRAVTMILEAVYEQDFLDCSFGFRPVRSAHQALGSLREGAMKMNGGWVVELDIQSFFDTLDHGHLRRFLDQRICDGVLRRTIDKWLAAGVLESGSVSHPESGTPQGGVVSPLLANVYLHEVLDKWFENEVKPRMRGTSFLIRYADDAVIVFSLESDARRVMDVLPKRFGKYGLTLHPEKTRLLAFCRPWLKSDGKGSDGGPAPGSFDFLGFTHLWSRTRHGGWAIFRRTAKSRFGRALLRIRDWCRKCRHLPVSAQRQALVSKLQGHYAYYGLTGNAEALWRFRCEVLLVWQKWLGRRSQRAWMGWDRFRLLLDRYPIPEPIVVHSVYRPQRSRNPKSRMR